MIKIFLVPVLLSILLFLSLHLAFPLDDKVNYSVVITASNGEMMHAFLSADEKWRMKTTLEEISPLLRKTIIQKEDRFFYYHTGVNPAAIARALFSNIIHRKRTSGASTITMQVARALERKPRNYTNKLVEIFRAWQLEMKYNKSEILQLYCNLLPYGGNVEGVKAASLLYFQKNPDHLSLAEITALSIIPNRPSSLVPGKANAAIKIQRDKWLNRFANRGVFSFREITDALAEPFEVSRGAFPKMAPHISLELKKRGTHLVRSTIDLNIQRTTEKIIQDYSRSLKLKNINNAAAVIIENATRKVIAYIGSADFADIKSHGEVNGVTAIRQPGSTLKPLVYAMCIDDGLITPKSVFADVNVSYGGYSPENFNRKYNGYVTTSYALEHSLNVPAVKALNALGKDRLISTLASCNFMQIRKDQHKLGLSMILGGCGASLIELTALYSSFSNGGRYRPPVYVSGEKEGREVPVMSEASAFMINEVLSKINRPDFPLNWQSTENMPKIAWKTGTSYGRRDAWSIGYNVKYTIGVWAGNFTGSSVTELSGSEIATPLLFKIFNTLDYDSDAQWFNLPEDCSTRIVCSETGMPPSENCSNRVTDYFLPMISPVAVCNNIQEKFVSPDERLSYCRQCLPMSGYKKKLYKVVPTEILEWLEVEGKAYERIPPHFGGCEQVFKNGKPVIISPHAGSEYLVNKNHPEPLQLKCRTTSDVSTIYWYINDRFYKSASAKAAVFFEPDEGPLKISCTDDKGRNRDVWVRVRYVDL